MPTLDKEINQAALEPKAAPTTHVVEPEAHTATKAAAHHAAKGRYIEAVGRRKTAIARVRISSGTGKIHVNGLELKGYFVNPRLQAAAKAPLVQLQLTELDVTAQVKGGGIHAQAEAIRLGISRAIIEKSPDWKPRLRAIGFVTRDSRMVERKKYGKNKARRSPQWAKR